MKRPKRACSWCQFAATPQIEGRAALLLDLMPGPRLYVRNRRPADDPMLAQLFARTNPKHYHCRAGINLLAGHRENVPWLGSSCPPQCPGLRDQEQYRPMEEFYREPARSVR